MGSEYKFLGNSGLRVSNICLGTMTFGEDKKVLTFLSGIEQDKCFCILDRYVELGGNFIDTADLYCQGQSETIIGNWLQKRGKRDDVIVATKVGFPVHGLPAPNNCGLSRRRLVTALEESLSRLQCDHLDLYQTHMWDNNTPVEETLRTLDDFVRCGKARYLGASNVCGWQLQKMLDTCDKMGYSPFVSVQNQCSLLRRECEIDVFDVARRNNVAVMAWSPLKGGALSGKFRRGLEVSKALSEETRVGRVTEQAAMQCEISPGWEVLQNDPTTLNVLDALHDISGETGRAVPQLAVRWLLQRGVTSAVVGVRTVEQLESNMAAGHGWELSDDQMKRLDEASAIPLPYPFSQIDLTNRTGMPC